MGKSDHLEMGQWNALCDRCGFKYKARHLRLEWTGLRTCSGPGTNDCWEPRHPQEFLRGKKDDQAPPWSRPDTPTAWYEPYLPPGDEEIPALVLDFSKGVYGTNGVQQSFSDIVTFTRAGTASYVDADGVTQTAGADVPRFDHATTYPFAPLGLLMDDTDGDAASIDVANWPSGLFGAAGTMLVVCRSQQTAAPTYRNVFEVIGATVNERVSISVIQSVVSVTMVDNAVQQANITLGAYDIGARLSISAAFATNNVRVSRNGKPVMADTSGTFPTLTRARIGIAEDRARIEKIILWNKVLPDAVLRSMSEQV